MRLAETEMEVILRIFCFCQTPERSYFLVDNCRNWRHKQKYIDAVFMK